MDVLGAFQLRRFFVFAGGSKHADAVCCGPPCGCLAGRACEHHQPVGKFAAGIFSWQGRARACMRETGLSYSILRPAVLFGGEDILINNIAWVLRHLPVFGVFGTGDYRLQPIHVHDFADLAVAQGAECADQTIDAIGPETFTYRVLVSELARILGVRRPIVSVPPQLGYAGGWLLGKVMGDVLISAMKLRVSCRDCSRRNRSQQVKRDFRNGLASMPTRWATGTPRSSAAVETAARRMRTQGKVLGLPSHRTQPKIAVRAL